LEERLPLRPRRKTRNGPRKVTVKFEFETDNGTLLEI
jgi:hypothetical protein